LSNGVWFPAAVGEVRCATVACFPLRGRVGLKEATHAERHVCVGVKLGRKLDARGESAISAITDIVV
jgi:hypothetical protein